MTQIRIDAVQKSKSGKAWAVKSGDQYYAANLDSGIEHLVGKVLEVEIKTFGKDGRAINKYSVVGSEAPQTPQIAPRAPQTLTQGSAPWWMPFASNTVAHAIQSGYIKEPSDIKVWVLAAKQAAESADSDVPM